MGRCFENYLAFDAWVDAFDDYLAFDAWVDALIIILLLTRGSMLG